jgi:hypothetical protein
MGIAAFGVGLSVLIFGASAAFGYWSYSDTTSAHPAAALADSILKGVTPAIPSTNGPNGNTVSFSFSQASTASGSLKIANYTITRYPISGSGIVTSAICSAISGTVNCSETAVPNGTWTYTDIPYIPGSNWTGIESAKSPPVTVDTSTPTASPVSVSGVTFATAPLWINGSDAVTLTDSPTDSSGQGIASVAYYACATSVGSCTSAHWTSIGSSSSGSSSYEVSWSPLPGTGVTYNVVAVATAINTNSSPVSSPTELEIDTAPVAPAPLVGASHSYLHSGTTYVNNGVNVSDLAADSGGAGVASVTYYYCAGTTGSCTSSDGIQIGTSTNGSGSYAVSWASQPADGAYRIVALATDNVGNATTSTSTVVTVDNTAPTVSAPNVNGVS